MSDYDALWDAGFRRSESNGTYVREEPGVYREVIGMTGPHGRWFGHVEYFTVPTRRGHVRTYLRGARRGMRLFKYASALIRALDEKRTTTITA